MQNKDASVDLNLRELIADAARHLRSARLPIFSIADSTICGYELLIRGPGRFADPELLFRCGREESLLCDLDRASLGISLQSYREIGPEMRTHVNLFAETILTGEINELLGRIFEDSPSKAVQGQLCIELIEMSSLPDAEELLKRLELVRNHGIELALDDVGCGASSVEAIILLEPDIIKLDRRFVSAAHADPERSRRLRRLVSLSKSVGARIVAEGIDSEADRSFAAELQIEMGQGLLSGPLPK